MTIAVQTAAQRSALGRIAIDRRCGAEMATDSLASGSGSSRRPWVTVASATPGPVHVRVADGDGERQDVSGHDNDVERDEPADENALSHRTELRRDERTQAE